MSGDNFGKGNEAFVAERYAEAVDFYNKAISEDESKDEYYANRAHAHIKLENYLDAVADATKAIELNPNNSRALLRKGIASVQLGEFESAKKSLLAGQDLDAEDKNFASWLQKCEEKLQSETPSADGAAGTSQKAPEQAAPVEIPMPVGPKTKYDWYQTETLVVITILLKNVKKDDATIDVHERSLSVTIKQASDADYSLELDLAYPVNVDKCSVKFLKSKVEVRLVKADGVHWAKLEGEPEFVGIKYHKVDSSTKATPYPSSAHVTRDWDKIVADIKKEEKDEKLEGDAALNSLFQQIYRDGSDEVKKAMNKSFVESAGTVLSTNWKDVKQKEVGVKPPDGMEYKSWEDH